MRDRELALGARLVYRLALRHRPALLRAIRRRGLRPDVNAAGLEAQRAAQRALRRPVDVRVKAGPPVRPESLQAPGAAARTCAHVRAWLVRLWARVTGRAT